jgi:erythromycin esterase
MNAIRLLLTLFIAATVAGQIDYQAVQSLTSTDFTDLKFLDSAVAGKRIVQLGESGHGMGEIHRLKARIARYLHERHGFNVLAFESSLYHGYAADRDASRRDARTTLINGTLGVWHTHEVLPLFEYLKETRTSSSPLRLAGFDVQPIGTLRRTRAAFFHSVVSAVDADYANAVRTADTAFFVEYDKGATARRNYLRANRDPLIAKYQGLAAFITMHLSRLQEALGREIPLVARQESLSMAAYIREQTAAEMVQYAESRDRGMADNLFFIARELFPEQKVIVWADNYHVRYANQRIAPLLEVFPGVSARSMGYWVQEAFGDSVYTIGSYPYEGRAVDNARVAYNISAPAPDSVEYLMHSAAAPLAFFSLRATNAAWTLRSGALRYNGQHAQQLIPREQYDALLFIERVSPPTFLY